MEYCETCNEFGEAGTPCEYCSQPYPTHNVLSNIDVGMTTIGKPITFQKINGQEPHTPIFNMSDLETVTKPPPITPQQHESYQN